MKALADYVHSKGLKLGIYSSPGPKTCAGYEGSYQHEEQDAKTYAGWGIDYLKYDLCSFREIMQRSKPRSDRPKPIEMMQRRLPEDARGARRPPAAPSSTASANMAATTSGSGARPSAATSGAPPATSTTHYSRMAEIGFGQAGLAKYAGPGHWNDPDMLEVGNGGMTDDEYRTHMSLWAILAAPLLAGNDLSKMTPETLAILTNKEVIAVDQDPLGKQGDRASAVGMTEIWTRPLSGGAVAAGLFNRDTEEHSVTLHLRDIGFEDRAKVRDLWKHEDVSATHGSYTVTVPAHGVVMLKVSK